MQLNSPSQIAIYLFARARPLLRLRVRAITATLALLLSAPGVTYADSATWSATPASGDWNTAGNWLPMTVPNGPSDTATFGSSGQTNISLSANTELSGIVVNAGASAYTITAAPKFELVISGAGITNNSGITQNFETNVNMNGSRGIISFHNSATAGNLVAFRNSSSVDTRNRSFTIFYDTSTAGSATFLNEGAAFVGSLGGYTIFWDESTAGTGTFTSSGGTASGAVGGITEFSVSSSAANGTFTANGGTAAGGGGQTAFGNFSTASNATLIANGGVGSSGGGLIGFFDDSLGGTARVKLFGNGHLDISAHNAPGLTTGSLEGDGDVFLGANNLVVGANNLSTTFSGVVRDGGMSSETGGSLTKVGTGTLTLSGENTYTGGTIVSGGRLLVAGASATGTGPVTVDNNGSVLGGTGIILGPVTVNAGAALLAGDATAAAGSLTAADDVTLSAGTIVRLVLGASGTHSTLSRTGGTWTFASNQAFDFINMGAQLGLYDNIITGLAGNPGGTASWTITTPGFAGTFSYDGSGNIDLNISAVPAPTPGTLANISTRLRVETGDNALIGGFIVTGTQPKMVIVRAIGPSLSSFFPGALANPILELRNSAGGLIMSNDNWRSTQEVEILATGIPPSDDLESAIVATLPANNAAYTAVVRGVDNGTGIGVVEAYDLDQTVDSKLANISTRGFVQTGDDVLIGGLIVAGQSPLRVLVRAIGPSLVLSGALENPTLELRDGNGALLQMNDDWRTDQETEIIATGIPPSNDLESAIVRNFAPGAYTAIVRGVSSTTGIAVVEAYGLN